jgi:hypothetical protein
VRVDGPWSQPAISLVLLFLAMILAPVTLYLYLAHPDWAWLYLVDSARVPRLAVITVLAAQGGALVGAWYGAHKLVRAGKEVVLRWALPATGALLIMLMVLVRHRLTHYGTYAQFHGGRALPILDVKLGYVLIAVLIGAGAAAGVVAYELMRDGKRAVAR